MNNSATTLGQRVRMYREARKLSLSDLTKTSGVSRSYLYQVENDASSPTEEKLVALANALGVTVTDLMGVDEDAQHIPESLAVFATQSGLLPSDVSMLARIHYRGQQPTTAEGWRALYSVIKATSTGDL